MAAPELVYRLIFRCVKVVDPERKKKKE